MDPEYKCYGGRFLSTVFRVKVAMVVKNEQYIQMHACLNIFLIFLAKMTAKHAIETHMP